GGGWGAVEVRHGDVAEDQMVGSPPEYLERLGPVTDGIDRMMIGCEHFAQQLKHEPLVVDNEDALAGDGGRRLGRVLAGGGRRRDYRKLDAKDRALAGLADEGQRSPVPLDDAVAEREAETRALTNRLGGKERLEDPIADLLRDSRARVLDVHRDAAARGVGAGAKREPARRRSLAQLVTGVGDQIDHDLVELVWI